MSGRVLEGLKVLRQMGNCFVLFMHSFPDHRVPHFHIARAPGYFRIYPVCKEGHFISAIKRLHCVGATVREINHLANQFINDHGTHTKAGEELANYSVVVGSLMIKYFIRFD